MSTPNTPVGLPLIAATPAEINLLRGATASDVGLVQGITAGTGAASKAPVLDSAKKFTNAVTAPTASMDGFTIGFTAGSATPGSVRAIVGSATTFTTQT